MNRLLICIVVGIGSCAISSSISAAPVPQNNSQPDVGNGQKSLSQTRSEIAALPASPDVASREARFTAGIPATSGISQSHSTFYRQSSERADVYDYPAVDPPRLARRIQSNFAQFQNNANARLTNRMSLGSNTSTGNLGPANIGSIQAPVDNLSPNASLTTRSTRTANSRSPVPQQQSSTISPRQSFATQATQFSTAQQAQAQAIQLARQAQAQQAQAQVTLAQAQQAQSRATQIAQASQPTTVFRQSVNQQPTLGLGISQAQVAQNCRCTTGYTPTGTYNPATAAYQVPGLNPYTGAIAPVNLQNLPAGSYLGTGIVGQPTAYVDGQPVRNLLRYISP